MTNLQTTQTTNHMSPNIHENPKLQINKHKVMILSKISNLNRKSRPITLEANCRKGKFPTYHKLTHHTTKSTRYSQLQNIMYCY